MAFIDLYKEVKGCVADLPIDYAKTLVNRARADAYRQNLWSFKLFDSNWASPAIVNAGTLTVTQGSTTVVADATAAAALTAVALGPPTPLTQRQLRVGLGTIYNIWGYVAPNLTLDRPYQEAGGAGTSYQVFQCYYPVPMQDFETFISIRDMINYVDLCLTSTRAEIDKRDPQRTWYYFPTEAVPYQLDQNPASPTYGWMMYELWGLPQYPITYQLYGLRKGLPLVKDTDTLPAAIGEDCVMALARKYAYGWAEGQKGSSPRNVGPDFRFLIGDAGADYTRLFRAYRKDDRETVNNFFSVRGGELRSRFDYYYNAISGTASPGGSIYG